MRFESAPTGEITQGNIVSLGEDLLPFAKLGFQKTEVDENTRFKVEEISRNALRIKELKNGEIIDIRIGDLFPEKDPATFVRKVVIN